MIRRSLDFWNTRLYVHTDPSIAFVKQNSSRSYGNHGSNNHSLITSNVLYYRGLILPMLDFVKASSTVTLPIILAVFHVDSGILLFHGFVIFCASLFFSRL